MENRKLSTYTQAQGGGRLNRKNIVVSRPENALKYAKSPNFNTAKITPKLQKIYGKNANKNELIFNKKACSQINSEDNLTKQNITSNKIKFFGLEQKSQTNKSSLKNNFINITLFGKKEPQSNLEHKYKNYSFNQYELNQNSNETSQRKIHKTKLLALIFSLFFIFSTLLTSGVFLIVNYVNKTNTNALNNDEALSIGNLLENGNAVKYTTYQTLLSALGNYGTTARTASNIKSSNGGNPLVFQMGEVNGNPIYWQVVYQIGDIITVWMTDSYTTDRFNAPNSSYTISTKNLNLLRKYIDANYASYNNFGKESSYSNYSKSILRDLTKAIYFNLEEENPVLGNIIQSPYSAGASWQTTTTVQPDSYYIKTNTKSHHNALLNPSGTGYFTSYMPWDTSTTGPYYDKFWIPSWYEVMNSSTTTASINGGLWGLSNEEIGYKNDIDSSNIASLDGTTYNHGSLVFPYRFWFRSGSSAMISSPLGSNYLGEAVEPFANHALGVRPACHIALSNLQQFLYKYSISIGVNNLSYGSVTGNGEYTAGDSATITATPATGYKFTKWVDASGNTVSTNANYTFSVTADGTYTAYFEPIIYTVTAQTSNSAYGTVSGGGSVAYGGTATITATPTQHYNFAYFLVSGSGAQITTNPYSFTASGDTTITAYFTPKQYTISISSSSTDYGVILNAGETMEYGSYYTTYAIPTGGCAFLYWEITASNGSVTKSITNPLNVAVDDNKTIKAVFANSLLSGVVCYAESGGEARMVGYANDDTAVTFMAVAYAGYQFDGWFIQGETTALNTNLSCSLDMATVYGKIIVAHFSKINTDINTDTETDNDFV